MLWGWGKSSLREAETARAAESPRAAETGKTEQPWAKRKT